MTNDKLNIPQSSMSDVAYTGISVALAAIPFLGAAEIFKATLTPPIEKRRDEWMQNAAEAIIELQQRNNVSIEELSQNEEFITILIEASRIAVGTHLKEKKSVLKNALINSQMFGVDYGTAATYLKIIDRITPVEIQIIKFIKDLPSNYFESSLSKEDPQDVFYRNINQYFASIPNNVEKVDEFQISLFIRELSFIGLIDRGLLGAVDMHEAPFYHITTFGEKFIEFIENHG